MEGFALSAVAAGMGQLPKIPRTSSPLPVPYQEAVQALVACREINEAMYWDNAAEALAAWAKIYGDDSVATEARLLKLHAYRRIGQLADTSKPPTLYKGKSGANALLQSHGFKRSQASEALAVARMPAAQFEAMQREKRPPSPSTLLHSRLRKNPSYALFYSRLAVILSACRTTDMKALAAGLDDHEREKVITAWAEVQDRMEDLCMEISKQPLSGGG